MSVRLIPVVGRPFARFAEHVGGFTAETALTALRDGTLLGPSRLHPGQGVTAAAWTAIGAAAAGTESTVDPLPVHVPVTAGLHQADPRNVLIADLEPDGDRRWRAALWIHPEAAPLSDRDNGTGHVPGMVEMEACLQAVMAGADRYLAPRPGAFDFTSQRVEIDFDAFMLPLAAAIAVRVDRIDRSRPEALALEATAEVFQAGRRLMAMRFHSRLFDHDHLHDLERRRAQHALAAAEPTMMEYR